ncbi:MAG: hypothetical protein D4R64_08545 [Porphyromonadaceae bacterium]|nr:MAG: hypothetical protein D4R64_08545 [Porphyromonadaceae bacterium]
MKKQRFIFASVFFNLIVLGGILVITSKEAKAAEPYWRFQSESCTYYVNGVPTDGKKYKCQETGDSNVCYNGWPDIPCGSPLPNPE